MLCLVCGLSTKDSRAQAGSEGRRDCALVCLVSSRRETRSVRQAHFVCVWPCPEHYFSRCISSRQPLYHAVGMGVLSKHKFPPGEGYQNTSFPRGPPGEILSFEIWIRCESTSPKYEIKFITNLSHLSRNYHEIYHGSQIEGSLPSAHRGGNPVSTSAGIFVRRGARACAHGETQHRYENRRSTNSRDFDQNKRIWSPAGPSSGAATE